MYHSVWKPQRSLHIHSLSHNLSIGRSSLAIFTKGFRVKNELSEQSSVDKRRNLEFRWRWGKKIWYDLRNWVDIHQRVGIWIRLDNSRRTRVRGMQNHLNRTDCADCEADQRCYTRYNRFVAEALVGANGSEQIRSFDEKLRHVGTSGG
jgi:hypothetical protein